MRRLKTIVITPPESVAGEADTIRRLICSGAADRVHIRKPGWDAERLAALIAAVPAPLRPRLSLHDHFELAAALGAGGVHLNSRSPRAPQGWSGLVSRSCHSIAELAASSDTDYNFLSPVFDSISKAGYAAAFGAPDLQQAAAQGIIGRRTVALGGVRPDHLPQLQAMGFGGAAMLGAVWEQPEAFIAAVRRYRLADFGLQFITHGATVDEVVAGAEAAVAGGCRWVQLRMKDAPRQSLVQAGRRIRRLCSDGRIFIVDDHVELVEELGADGVHLGRNDMPVDRARAILGPDRIIGATANTAAHILEAAAAGADYIGLGPFRFTTTKKNLSPVLGAGGYRGILGEVRAAGVTLPVVAIGGITAADVATVMDAGADGVAVSGAILSAADPVEATRIIMNQISTKNE